DDGSQPRVVRSASVPERRAANVGAAVGALTRSGMWSGGCRTGRFAVVVRRLSSGLLALACLAVATLGRPTAQTRTAPSVVAIRGGTVLTVTRGTLQNATVLLRDGKIAAVGANIPIPSGADIVDATGRFISPGLIDCHSHIAADSINEGGTTVSSMTGIEDVFNPTDVNIYRDLAG